MAGYKDTDNDDSVTGQVAALMIGALGLLWLTARMFSVVIV